MKKYLVCSLLMIFNICFGAIASAQSIDEKLLNKKQQSIIMISAFTAQGDLENLKVALNKGLDSGLTINQIKEVLVQMYAYAGFPRSLNGLNTFMEVLQERKEQGIKDVEGAQASPVNPDRDRLAIGTSNQTQLVGSKVTGKVYEFAPIIDTFLKEHLFGDIFERDILTYQERELATVAALAGIGNVNNQLKSHMKVSMNNEVTAKQLQALVDILHDNVDIKIGENAQVVLNQVLAK